MKEQQKDLNFCNGFTDNMKAMRKERVHTILNKLYRYDNIVRSAKDNIIIELKKGRTPKKKIITTYRRGRVQPGGVKNDWDEFKKEIYCLENKNGYLEINKTEYDYAIYLLNLGLENVK